MVTEKQLDILSRLVLAPDRSGADLGLEEGDLQPLRELAGSHHVLVRAFEELCKLTAADHPGIADWASPALLDERRRIDNALPVLQSICAAFAAEELDLTVIKSLDHWPDLGSDLDLYTNAYPEDVIRLMSERFHARLAPRSWGDRLAGKWNFVVPGLPELVEIHVRRLGQTGEHVSFARSIPARAVPLQVNGFSFSVACAEHRLMIATLQRMYRHFYFRLCDIVDTVTLLETRPVNYQLLQTSAVAAGIWEGVASFLHIVSGYIQRYRGRGLDLPDEVRSAARLSADRVTFQNRFLRVPILPEAVNLYTSQLASLALQGEVRGTLRLSLLPCLATAAALEQRITGSDKGIW